MGGGGIKRSPLLPYKDRFPGENMSLFSYLILGLVAVYLFQVNPVLCVVLAGAVVFFKVRGKFGGKHDKTRSSGSAATEAALVAMCIALLERGENSENLWRHQQQRSHIPEDDFLGGLFLEW